MRSSALLPICLAATLAHAQVPVDVQWSALNPYGSGNLALLAAPRLCADNGRTAWMLYDQENNWTTSDGVIRRFDQNGVPLTGWWPDPGTIGCGSLDRPIDFAMRNDSLWGISYRQFLTGFPQDVLYCAQTPGGNYQPDHGANGEDLHDGVHDMHLHGSHWYLCAWQEVAPGQTQGRVLALDHSADPLWETVLGPATFGNPTRVARKGDSLAVAAFPLLFWLDAADGSVIGSTVLYEGEEGAGRISVRDGQLNWAVSTSDELHYGRLAADGTALWSGSTTAQSVAGIGMDDQGRLWIGGSADGNGRITRIDANGTPSGSWPYAVSVSDLRFADGRLMWTGRFQQSSSASYLISAIPQP